jgi:hypothetical protein
MRASRSTWLALGVVLAACVPYLPTIDDYFTQDDFGVVQLLASRSWSTFPRWFTMPWMEQIWGYTPDEIRPFVAFTYQVTALPGAGRPELHHAVNILFHAANALLVMALARLTLGVRMPAAAYAGLVFALLPVQAESVAWITGRVDSMPAFFYLASFAAYVRWRLSATPAATSVIRGSLAWYGFALALFFIALFSKQNTITMVATLAAYDLFVLDRDRRGSLTACVAAWLPFALMTLGYLGLRRALFGASVRGGIESREQVALVGDMIERHLLRTVLGHAGSISLWEWFAIGILLAAVVTVLVRMPRLILPAAALTVGWWAIGAAPVLVAGYESPRHGYLAAAGWALLLGLLADQVPRVHNQPSFRRVALTAILFLPVAVYAVRLHDVVQTWGSWARVSRVAVDYVSAEAARVPQGTLLLVNVPRESWEWATPFVLRPPYSAADVSSRVNLITPFRLHCCGPEQWNTFTREQLAAWARGGSPIVAIDVAPGTGAVSRTTDSERPELRTLVPMLADADSWHSLDRTIVRLMEQVVRR